MINAVTTFTSLADETRLRILALLIAERELCVCDLVAVLQLPQSTVSRHLAHLKKDGWLQDRRVGVWGHYSLVREPSPLHQSLLPILRHFLHDNLLVRSDLDRLRRLSKACCAD